MEEILASIRRIISDDGDDAPPPAKGPGAISTEAIDALFGSRAAAEDGDPIPSFLRQEPAPRATRPPEPRVEAPRPEPRAVTEPRPKAEPSPRVEPSPRPVLPAQPAAMQPQPATTEPPRTEIPQQTPPTAPQEELQVGRPLLSPAADAAVTASFGDLATTLLSGHARTLEDLVKDMLRPMLKSWLDTNLPPLVERLVRDEIERVSRGR